MDDTLHFKEELQELLDDRPSRETRLEIEKHLEFCDECRREFRALSWAKELSRKHYEADSTPDRLQQDISAALDLEDLSQHAKAGPLANRWTSRRALVLYSLLLFTTVALIVFYFVLGKPPGKQPELAQQPEPSKQEELPSRPNALPEHLPSEVASDYINYKAGGIPLTLMTKDVKQMEKFFSEQGISFETRVFDLAMMNYRLLGGRVHKLGTRKSAFFVYRGKNNAILVCEMYPGQVSALPRAAVERENKGIRFYVYRMKELTLAFWQEGAITCVLASDINPEEVVQLAFAKAVKV